LAWGGVAGGWGRGRIAGRLWGGGGGVGGGVGIAMDGRAKGVRRLWVTGCQPARLSPEERIEKIFDADGGSVRG